MRTTMTKGKDTIEVFTTDVPRMKEKGWKVVDEKAEEKTKSNERPEVKN